MRQEKILDAGSTTSYSGAPSAGFGAFYLDYPKNAA
jgi:hypothetical protein